ncbi:CatB-related O-acetyltransferase [Pseudomonas saudiphocaensis]|uniref:CatB-related O-acetyltransferase n=1 Tax=Pseudomonas saudiphocaensis TaxID=1499686 RepID=UPI00187D5091|nr:CatB-related O-acetyltransferase [Pseudomonas saudiphocaensis]MBE7927513.1 CatB-related O-acetyltransferase [Pseudomonas saudiphocaensis]
MFKKIERKLRKLKNKLRSKKEVPRLHRAQIRFNQRYPNYVVGIGTYGIPIVHDWGEGSTLKIGKYCSIANNVQILLGGLHRTDWITTFPFPAYIEEASQIKDYGGTKGSVLIGNDVWLCTDSIVLSGVTIGHGAVVACGAVVTRNVEPYSIVAGNPARHVRWRFDEKERERLLSINWWDWQEQEVRQAASILCSTDIEALISYAATRKSDDKEQASHSSEKS